MPAPSPYKVIPKPGSSAVEIADIGFNEWNAEIVEVRHGIIWNNFGGYNPVLAEDLRAEKPPVRVMVGTPKTAKVFTRRMAEERKLYAGSPPIRQVICDVVGEYDRAKKLISVRELVDMVSRMTDEKKYRIANLVKKMNEKGQIFISPPLPSNGNVAPGFQQVAPKKTAPVIDFVEGVHPVKMYIYEYVDRYGIRTGRDIERELMDMQWVFRPKTVRKYIEECVDEGILSKVGSNSYEAGLPPHPISKKEKDGE